MWSQPYAVRAESYVSQTWDCEKRPTLEAPSQEGKSEDNGAPEPDSNQFTQTLPASQGLELWNLKKKPERKIKCYDWTSKARAFGKCHESQRDRKLVHREGTVRHALLTVGQPSEKELASEFWHRHACNIKSYVQKWMARSTWTMPKTTFKTEEGKYTQYI